MVTDTDVALIDRLWQELEDHRWEEAITLSGQLAALLNQERDRQAVRWIGEVLLIAADQLAWIGGTASRVTRLVVALHAQALLDRGMAISWRLRLTRLGRSHPRPRWSRSVDTKLHYDRMTQALWLFDCLIARFDREFDPEARRLVARAQIARIVPLFNNFLLTFPVLFAVVLLTTLVMLGPILAGGGKPWLYLPFVTH